MLPLASDVLHTIDQFFFPCWLTVVSIVLECIIIRRVVRHEPFFKLCIQATIVNLLSMIITPFALSGSDFLFSSAIMTSTEHICYYACIPFTNYFVRCFVSPAWFMITATISDTILEAPMLWLFFNRKKQIVSTKQLWLSVLLANIITNGIAIGFVIVINV